VTQNVCASKRENIEVKICAQSMRQIFILSLYWSLYSPIFPAKRFHSANVWDNL
jgi:hypothetical protein